MTPPDEPELALETLLDRTPIGMALTVPGGRFARVNPALCELLGYSEEELLGLHLADVTHPDDLEASLALGRQLRAGEIDHGRMPKRYLHRDGHTIWTMWSFAAVGNEREPRHYVISQLQDITAERAAALARAELAAVVESSSDAIITATLDGTIRTWNAGAERIYGYSSQEAIGAHGEMLTPGPRERELQRDLATRVCAGEIVEPMEVQRRRRDGGLIDMSVTVSPVRDPDGVVIGISSVGRDITERTRAEQELARSRDLLRQAEELAQMGSWEWDIARDQITWSEGLYRIFKMTPEDAHAPATAEETIPFGLAHRVSPEDRESMREALDRTVSTLTRVVAQFRAIRSDGRVRVLDWHADPIVDASGTAVKVIGIVRDITESKRTQETLSAASADLVRYAQELQRLASEEAASDEATTAGLSPRQMEVLQLVAQGMTNAEIAKRIFISEGTVKWHLKQILLKTNTANRTEAVARTLGADRS